MRKITKRSAAVVTAAVVAVGGAGAAWAAWSLNSSHETTATAGEATPLDVTNLQIVGTLLPGSTSSVKFTAHNSNSFPVQISNISYSDVSTSTAACPAYNLQQVPLADAPLPTDLGLAADPAGGSTKTFTYANSLRLKPNPDNGCQKATFTFKVNLTVASTSA
jgi:hypothetical protein